MYPVLFSIGGFSISTFGVMIVIAFLVCNYILKNDLKDNNINPDYADDIIFRAALGGILGAKIYYLIENIGNGSGENLYGIINIIKGIFTLNSSLISAGIQSFGSGLVFLGGLIGGLIMVSIYIKQKSLIWLVMADLIAPLIALGHAIGRIGCLLVGDDYGIPSNLPWALSFPNGSPPSSAYYISQAGYELPSDMMPSEILSVHPTQIYEMVIYFLIFLFLKKMLSKEHFKGEIFMNYLFLAGLGRFLVEFLRLNHKYFLDLSGAQYISLLMMLLAGSFHYYVRKTDNHGKN